MRFASMRFKVFFLLFAYLSSRLAIFAILIKYSTHKRSKTISVHSLVQLKLLFNSLLHETCGECSQCSYVCIHCDRFRQTWVFFFYSSAMWFFFCFLSNCFKIAFINVYFCLTLPPLHTSKSNWRVFAVCTNVYLFSSANFLVLLIKTSLFNSLIAQDTTVVTARVTFKPGIDNSNACYLIRTARCIYTHKLMCMLTRTLFKP